MEYRESALLSPETHENKSNFTSGLRFSRRLIVFVCYIAVVLVVATSLLERRAILGQNDASRWDTVWSLINGKGYIIDMAPYATVDKVYRQGHFYSSKPALLPTMVAGITFVISKTTGLSLPESDYLLTRLVILVVNLVPFAAFLAFYGRWLLKQRCSDFANGLCLCTAAFGTYLTTYTITLNNHTVAALGVFFSLLIFERILTNELQSWPAYLLCGIFSAWAVSNELISFPFWFFIFGYLVRTHKTRTLVFFLPGTLLISLAFLLSTCIATGDCIPFYLKHDLYRYPGSYWEHPVGIDAANEPKLLYFWNFVLGHHGILSLTPVLIFSFLGLISSNTFKPIRVGAIVLTTINTLLVIFGSRNYGGDCQGARWFIWLIPVWLFCMPAAAANFTQSSQGKVLSIIVFSVSVVSILYGMLAHPAGPWSSSWIQDCMRAWGWISY